MERATGYRHPRIPLKQSTRTLTVRASFQHIIVCAGWTAAAYALVGRMDLAEMASAAAEAEAASRQAPVQALRPGPSMALGAASALEERAQAQGGARRPHLSPLWQPKLRTPAPGMGSLHDS